MAVRGPGAFIRGESNWSPKQVSHPASPVADPVASHAKTLLFFSKSDSRGRSTSLRLFEVAGLLHRGLRIMIQVCRDACWALCRFNGCRSTGCLQNCCYCAGARGFKAPRPQLGVGHRVRRRAFAAPRAKLLDQQATVGRQQPIERQQSGDILRHTTTKLGAGTGPWQRGFGSRASSRLRQLMTQEKSAQRLTTF